MDDIAVRPRYPRYGTISKKRRRNLRDDSSLVDKITRQVLVSIIVLIIIVSVKSINTPVTNYVTERVKAIATSNIEIKALYEWIDKVMGKSINEETGKLDENTYLKKESVTDMNNSTATGYENEPKSATGAEEAEILESIDEVGEIKMKYSFVTPVEGVLSSGFGEIKDIGTGAVKIHKGIDIEVKNESPVKAAFGGVVSESGSERTYGNYIKVRHDEGIEAVYAHCSQILVRKGQEVEQGDAIAKVGSTEAFVGSHLHFEIWKDGKVINPLYLVDVPSY